MRALILVMVAGCYIPRPRTDATTTRSRAASVEVKATAPATGPGWLIEAKNKSDVGAKLIWDESTFVTADGKARGRLMRGRTKMIDIAKEQPDSPIPAGAVYSEIVIPEQHAWYLNKPQQESDDIPVVETRGRLVLVFAVGEEREVWVGDVHRRGSKPDDPSASGPGPEVSASFFCASSKGGARFSVCGRTLDLCEEKRRSSNQGGVTTGDLGACGPSERAFCYDSGQTESCHPTPKACNDSRGAAGDATGDCSLRR